MAGHLLLGVDISLSNTGICGRLANSSKFRFANISASEHYKNPNGTPITEGALPFRFQAYQQAVGNLMSFVNKFNADSATVCIEYYSLMSASRSVFQIVEFSSLIKSRLYAKFGGSMFEPTASQVKKFATGHGGSAKKQTQKDDMKLAVFMEWKVNLLHHDDNRVDAFVLMRMAQSLHNEKDKLTSEQADVVKEIKRNYQFGTQAGQKRRSKVKVKRKSK